MTIAALENVETKLWVARRETGVGSDEHARPNKKKQKP